ncbi:MAG: NADP oxidoreductase [Deltaproteobacteria bacterium]|nr:MAG: NADP oxidoreductase [Deltaproteobacteria bacterium]
MRIAIVGSGPSGFYAAQSLLASHPTARIDLLERLPTPYGLVRGGVAPDHQKIKRVVKTYAKTAADPRVRWFGNIELGRDVTIDELLARYDQVVLAVGAQSARKLGIPGEDLRGVFTATEFVAWYNAHPQFQDRAFPLHVKDVVVVGVGNVAMDVARILLASRSHLAGTDITAAALDDLTDGKRTRVHVLGRRGPAQAAFTPKELREIAELEGVDVRTRANEVELDPLSAAWLAEHGTKADHDNVAFVKECAGAREERESGEMWLRFCTQPVEILGEEGKVAGVRVERTEIIERNGGLSARGTGETEVLPAGLVLEAVGYRMIALPGVPFDAKRGVVPHVDGAVIDGESRVPDLFVVGWAKRGPSGLIGTNKGDSAATVATMLELGVVRPAEGPDPEGWLLERQPMLVRWEDWERLDELERVRGAEVGKVREKFTSVQQMLAEIDCLDPNCDEVR